MRIVIDDLTGPEIAALLEAHGILPADLEASRQIGPTWTLPDGRVWLREIRPDPA